MKLEIIETDLPNGFHDAVLRSYSYDLQQMVVSMALGILVGLPDDPPHLRDSYREGVIVFEKVSSIIGPELTSVSLQNGSSGVVISETPATSQDVRPGLNPDFYTIYEIFVIEWQASLHVCAESISFQFL